MEPVVIKVILQMPPTHARVTKMLWPWQDKIVEETGGKVHFRNYYACSLVPVGEMSSAIMSGFAEMGEVCQNKEPDRYPISQISTLSPLGVVCEKPSLATWEVYQNTPAWQEELEKVGKALWVGSGEQQMPHLVNKQIKTLEDAKGLKIGVSGRWIVKQYQALGFVPVDIPFADFYSACEKGTIEGYHGQYESLVSWKFGEVTKYSLEIPFATWPMFYVISWDFWNNLPPNIQEVFEKYSGNYIADLHDGKSLPRERECKAIGAKEMGHVSYTLPQEEVDRWFDAVQPVIDEWAADLAKRGIPNGREIWEEFNKHYSNYALEDPY